ncbi:exosortase K [uncultured Psychroserpens sp.]|uniref:exosortase K n=1 Tax=uncultured Psychroserpens sp. TaxID=255436 RepID=UPI00260CDBAF|nr:exosortase K [uncultured Psychroserpens sp.]
MIKNSMYYLIAFVLVVILKFMYAHADNDMVLFMLKPINGVVETIANQNATYTSAIGFYFENLNIIIDKSCSGVNFWLISFMLFMFSLLKHTRTLFENIIVFPIAFAVTYLLTLFANISRILISIFIEKNTSFDYTWMHQAQGVFVYLTFLILFYLLTNHFISKSNIRHAKFA